MIFLVKTFSFDNVDEEREKKDFENMRELNVLLRKAFTCGLDLYSVGTHNLYLLFVWGKVLCLGPLYNNFFSALNANVAHVSFFPEAFGRQNRYTKRPHCRYCKG